MFADTPSRASYDLVIIGGAIMGSSAAWHVISDPDFQGQVLVVERDPSYATSSTAHTTSCIRQQFSSPLNISVSQFGAEFVKGLHAQMGHDPDVPDVPIRNFGYMYLADTPGFAELLRANAEVQRTAGTQTQLMDADALRAAYPFYTVEDILLGSINLKDEGYFDGALVFDVLKRQARKRGVEYVTGEVTGLSLNASGRQVETVTLASGQSIACGAVLNAAGPRASQVAAMAGIDIPVEPRKRYSWVFKAETPLDRDLPLTIDPSGVHVRENGNGTYQAGGHGADDPAVDPDDFDMDHGLWEAHVWPVLAHRIPAFEAVRVTAEWAGHYAYNTLDQNAIVGPHPNIGNFHFLNGFSGHGLQQAPAMGRGFAELFVHGAYRSLDLTPFGVERVLSGTPLPETAII